MHPSTRALSRQIKVPFHGTDLYVVEHDGQPYTAVKPIVEGMGLDWKSQQVKMRQRFRSSMAEIAMIGGDGQLRPMTCLPVRKLPGWLHSISLGKVRPAVRERVAEYQAECDDALWRFWNAGVNVNMHQVCSGREKSTSADRADALRLATELVIDRHVPYSSAYRVMHFYAGACSFRDMSRDQAMLATEFASRLLSHLDTLGDWEQIDKHRSRLLCGPVQLSLALHPRLGPSY
ncbi:hypothetical protein AYM40_05730 [Paraburkholderia phytofirmans OLGA172]|uniref:Antirepressor protein ant N-terminal domain-containing protein n=1 Tax=Paraburkholderia phytofirmans OLGA172 TaxID=1417228 RepID=A0A160FJ43_9BURK|nr:phage antirepressor N-terminal domain-containing protein [Paraburkholderia phytofirmans]ANB71928.1 hypothetical protein AYM40_05730 [Paraburkholderia phytofirmans OLGA172]